MLITALLALAVTWNSGWSQRLLWSVASVMLMVLLVMVHIAYQRDTTVAVRNFYGALRVKQTITYPGITKRTLMNGIIEHGTQIFGSDELRKTPTTYYARDSGVGLALRNCCPAPGRIPIQARIDQAPVRAASASSAWARAPSPPTAAPATTSASTRSIPPWSPIARNVFTYIRDSGAQVDIVVGDARTSLAREAPQHFDVLVVDAFSGDAIPIHLLTREALASIAAISPPAASWPSTSPTGMWIWNRRSPCLPPPPAWRRATSTAGERQTRRIHRHLDAGHRQCRLFPPAGAGRPAFGPDTRPGLRLWTDDYSAFCRCCAGKLQGSGISSGQMRHGTQAET